MDFVFFAFAPRILDRTFHICSGGTLDRLLWLARWGSFTGVWADRWGAGSSFLVGSPLRHQRGQKAPGLPGQQLTDWFDRFDETT